MRAAQPDLVEERRDRVGERLDRGRCLAAPPSPRSRAGRRRRPRARGSRGRGPAATSATASRCRGSGRAAARCRGGRGRATCCGSLGGALPLYRTAYGVDKVEETTGGASWRQSRIRQSRQARPRISRVSRSSPSATCGCTSPAWAATATTRSRSSSRATGCYVCDEHGKRYLDGLAALFCVNIGHGRGDVAQAGADQAKELGFYTNWNYAHPKAIELAARVAELAPGDLNRVFFTSGGSEAVDSALKLCRQYHKLTGNPGRYKVDLAQARLPRHDHGRAHRDRHPGRAAPVRAAVPRRLATSPTRTATGPRSRTRPRRSTSGSCGRGRRRSRA